MILEFVAGEGELSRRLGAWLDAHPAATFCVCFVLPIVIAGLAGAE